MKILVSGGGGLLAHCLRESAAADRADDFVFLGHAEFDLTRTDLMGEQLAQLRPDVVINTAAYNLVDRCEIERDLSWSVNALGPEALARLCAEKMRGSFTSEPTMFSTGQKNPPTPRPTRSIR